MAKPKWKIPFPMHNAGQTGDVKPKTIFDELMEWPDPDVQLLIAACHGNANIMDIAIKKGANVNISNGVVMRYAAELGLKDEVDKLLKLGANPRANDSAAFRWACAKGHLEIAETLKKAGAEIHSMGDCALQWAIDNKKQNVVDWLTKAGCYIDEGEPYKEEHARLKKDEIAERKQQLLWRPEKDLDPNQAVPTVPASAPVTTVPPSPPAPAVTPTPNNNTP
jgi:hypothetical protein